MSDPYKILGVDPNISDDELKKAYKRLTMKYHPDRGGSEEKFKEITDAYEKIKNQKKNTENITFTYNESIFQHRFQIGITVKISFKDSILGGFHYVKIPARRKEEVVQIKIPEGVTTGTKIRYPNLIKNFDIIITFIVEDDPEWKLSGIDLIKIQKISIWNLIKGCDLDVELLDGTKIRIKIPPRTQPGTMMRIKNKGLKSPRNLLEKGDLLVELDAFIPEDIPKPLLVLINQLGD